MPGAREYQAYHSAKNRCNNPRNPGYKYYGGRGIRFLFTSFEQFFAELGPRPPGLSLDRIDNDGNYEPGNARWAARSEQRRNQRRYTKIIPALFAVSSRFTPTVTTGFIALRFDKNRERRDLP
jgi:hypothetical protein